MTKSRIWKSRIVWGDFLGLFGAITFIITLIAFQEAKPNITVEPKNNKTTSQTITPQTTSENEIASPPPSSSPSPPPKPSPASRPSTVLNLSNWKLTLPVDTPHAGAPDEIMQPELSTFTLSPYFQPNGNKNGVVFRANVGGATTSGSQYPRSELREMTGSGKYLASWSSTNGTHTMTIRQAITHLPVAKPDVVAGQIHDATGDVIMIRLEGKRLFIEGDGEAIGELETNYSLGTVFTVKVMAAEGRIKVYYNDLIKMDYSKTGSGYYFKAGCYTQSNLNEGDSVGAYGEVVIYDLQVSHT